MQLQGAGWMLLLVTGRVLEDLLSVFPRADIFDLIVAETGALLYNPETEEIKLLAAPPPPSFIEDLRQRGVPLGLGKVIVATVVPHEREVAELIAGRALPLQIILNKGAVMVLPVKIDKGSGLIAALAQLEIDPCETVGVGDAENDDTFLARCGFSAAVANALPELKAKVDFITTQGEGAGVVELVERLL